MYAQINFDLLQNTFMAELYTDASFNVTNSSITLLLNSYLFHLTEAAKCFAHCCNK